MMSWLRKYCKSWTIADYLLALIVLVFPFYNKGLPILLVLLGLTLFIQRNSKEEIKAHLMDFKSPAFWCTTLFFVHIVGVFWSTNTSAAWEDVGMKLSLIALPILFTFAKISLTKRQILDLFLVGIVSTSILLLIFAAYRTLVTPPSYPYRFFIASDFCYTMHRSYYAMYASIGVLITVYRLFVDKKWLYLPLAIFLFVITILTLSKAGLLISLIVLPLLLAYLALRIFSVKVLVISLVGFLGFAAVIVWQSPTIKGRLGAMLDANRVATENKNTTEGNAVRVIMWSTSSKLIKENVILGVGTGDVNDALDARNRKLGYNAIAKQSFNSHNQYLNTWVALGLIGFIPLCLLFISSWYKSIQRKNMLLFFITLVFAMNLLFESMFETAAGVVPIILILVLLSNESILQRRD